MTPQYVMRKSLCRPAHCWRAWKKGVGHNAGSGTDHEGVGQEEFDRQRLRAAESEIDNMGYAREYAELGYSQPERGILFANWNVFPRGLDTILERMGYSVEWSDEWHTCEGCNKAIRCSPDCYDWQASYVMQNDSIVCRECCDKAEYLREVCEDNQRAACPEWIDPAEHGYKLLSEPNEFKSGFHPGMNDNPDAILAELHKQGHTRVVFRHSEQSQFYIGFEVYVWTGTPEERLQNIHDYIQFWNPSTDDADDMLWHGRREALEKLEALQEAL